MSEILQIAGLMFLGFCLGVLFVVLFMCAISPLCITKESTSGEQPLVKLGEGRGVK